MIPRKLRKELRDFVKQFNEQGGLLNPRIEKRATSLEEKREVTERLLSLWEQNPDLRLGQLIGNVYHYPSGIDPYFDEDFELIEKLEAAYAESNEA